LSYSRLPFLTVRRLRQLRSPAAPSLQD